ncbi:hypothetical protein M758_7G057500 [Ceratodon purpureus]|uniref:Uncharacterized protein n=1 Tax=Ceratodon purpureus TaxID=3225 RepID=A0A8T0H805_CERPU|nr:hypothetical protein KC19_7G060300 [Ceratodon purpureus]KAG0610335.1 hypothetical protein M758_7G057500 [Ceratodon purpureus]
MPLLLQFLSFTVKLQQTSVFVHFALHFVHRIAADNNLCSLRELLHFVHRSKVWVFCSLVPLAIISMTLSVFFPTWSQPVHRRFPFQRQHSYSFETQISERILCIEQSPELKVTKAQMSCEVHLVVWPKELIFTTYVIRCYRTTQCFNECDNGDSLLHCKPRNLKLSTSVCCSNAPPPCTLIVMQNSHWNLYTEKLNSQGRKLAQNQDCSITFA